MTTINNAPVVLFTYRKRQFLEEIFQAIKSYSPPRLYVVSNLYSSEEERLTVEAIRHSISQWQLPGEIIYLFQDQHLLINDSIHNGLDHVFSIEESAIVLEDDTVPSSSFFDFCNRMLARYENAEEIGSIIGCNLGASNRENKAYIVPFAFFYWGWATWAEKWQTLRNSPLPYGKKDNGVIDKLQNPNSLLTPFFERLDDRCTWDLRWGWKQALHDMEAIIPGKNLVQNKGFVKEGSYIRFTDSSFIKIEATDSPTPAKAKKDPVFSRNYEHQSAKLLTEILTHRGELEKYKMSKSHNS
ncbi:hypothetical protein A3754_16035 [Alcanivorax sp. HI0083]|nr:MULTISPECIES: hypothetical protein [unclassified Alcanivorax]KZY35654.1 hypothetical protein A3730_14355 [Alcanivorax sp. HI0044]KZZ24890.1 hypothetical protein A3754_16035 [Alcanivorax sp. HI0083]